MSSVVIVLVALMAILANHLGESASPRGKKSETRECVRRYIPKKMLHQLSELTSDLIKSLPSDDIKHVKLLCNFGKSIKKTNGIRIIKEMVDFYQDVFRDASLQDETQTHIQTLLARLGKEVQHCAGPDRGRLPPAERNCIKKMNKTFIELKTHGVYKAVGEFHKVLEWIDSYIHQKTPRRSRKTKAASQNKN